MNEQLWYSVELQKVYTHKQWSPCDRFLTCKEWAELQCCDYCQDADFSYAVSGYEKVRGGCITTMDEKTVKHRLRLAQIVPKGLRVEVKEVAKGVWHCWTIEEEAVKLLGRLIISQIPLPEGRIRQVSKRAAQAK